MHHSVCVQCDFNLCVHEQCHPSLRAVTMTHSLARPHLHLHLHSLFFFLSFSSLLYFCLLLLPSFGCIFLSFFLTAAIFFPSLSFSLIFSTFLYLSSFALFSHSFFLTRSFTFLSSFFLFVPFTEIRPFWSELPSPGCVFVTGALSSHLQRDGVCYLLAPCQ